MNDLQKHKLILNSITPRLDGALYEAELRDDDSRLLQYTITIRKIPSLVDASNVFGHDATPADIRNFACTIEIESNDENIFYVSDSDDNVLKSTEGHVGVLKDNITILPDKIEINLSSAGTSSSCVLIITAKTPELLNAMKHALTSEQDLGFRSLSYIMDTNDETRGLYSKIRLRI